MSKPEPKVKEVKMTFEQMNDLANTYTNMLQRDPALENTKFGYAVNKFIEKNIGKIFKEYNVALSDIRIEYALVDEGTKAVLLDKENARGFKYGREELKKVIKAENKLNDDWEAKEYTVEPHIVKEADLPKLNETQKDVFRDFVV